MERKTGVWCDSWLAGQACFVHVDVGSKDCLALQNFKILEGLLRSAGSYQLDFP